MYKIVSTILVGFFATIEVFAMEMPHTPDTAPTCKMEQTFLFELTPKYIPEGYQGGLTLEEYQKENKGYILGTKHDLPLDVFPKPVREIIDSAKTLFVEIAAEGYLSFEKFSYLAPFQNIVDHAYKTFFKDEISLILDQLNSFSNTISPKYDPYLFMKQFQLLKPWALYCVLGRASLSEAYKSYKGEQGMDASIYKNAILNEIPVIGLETEQSRISCFGFNALGEDKLLAETKILLKNMAKSSSKEDNSQESDVNYFNGSLVEMESSLDDSNDLTVANKEYCYNRNWRMVDTWKMNYEDATRPLKFPFLVAVGVAHVVGKEGLLSQPIYTNRFYIKRVGIDGVAREFTYKPTT